MFGEWAGATIDSFDEEFGADRETSQEITDRVRRMLSHPSFEEFRERYDMDAFADVFVKHITASMRDQDGDSIEERWNGLVRTHSLHSYTEKDLFFDDDSTSSYSGQQTLEDMKD